MAITRARFELLLVVAEGHELVLRELDVDQVRLFDAQGLAGVPGVNYSFSQLALT